MTHENGTNGGVGSTGGSALLLQIDALIAELMNHNKYPSADAYVMASKLRRTLLGQPDAPSPNVGDEPRAASAERIQ